MSFRIPYHGAGIALIRSKNDDIEIFMGKRSRFPFFGSWSIPGGSVEEKLNETEYIAASRELYEETGIDLEKISKTYLGTWTKQFLFFKWVTIIFQTDNSLTDTKPCEFFRLKWIQYKELYRYYRRPFTMQEMRYARSLYRSVVASSNKLSQN